MKLWKESRAASFAIVTAIYVFAAVVGIAVYRVTPLPVWARLLVADVAATAFTFLFSLIFRNASVYDPYWSVQPPVILLCFAIGRPLTLPRILVLIAVFYWGIRLTANWAYTFRNLTHQDWRYTMLQEKTGAWYPLINFIGIHFVPTLVVYACVLPAVALFFYQPDWNVGSVVGFLLSVGATTMQAIADVQMQKFRKAKRTDGKQALSSPATQSAVFIRSGLWKYSRHPNYLGEILMWWGIAVSCVSVLPAFWYLAAGALLNTLLFAFVSIPMAEKRQAKKPGFAAYKRETRLLLPIKK